MARVVVVGGGFGGMASAARLARLGHQVTLLQRGPSLGGALAEVTAAGFAWDAGPHATLLPAVLRDLFRKTGRPLEQELDLVPLPVIREHRFPDGSRVRLPGGSRAAQVAAFDALAPGLGRAWVDFVTGYSPVWDVLRRDYLERPYDPDLASRETVRLLASRRTLAGALRRLPDRRLRLVAAHPLLAQGNRLRQVPAWLGITGWLEQRFGAWTVPAEAGGLAAVTGVLAARLAQRGVTVHTGIEVRDVVVRGGRAVAVLTADGELAADAVVCAVDPHRLPALARHAARTSPAPLPAITHLGLTSAPPLPAEVVLHGDPTLVVVSRLQEAASAGDTAERPAGPTRVAWTVHARGRPVDPVAALAARGLDVRDAVAVRVDRSPAELAQAWGGSPYGVQWRGRATVGRRLGPRTPVPGVYAAGAHATPGAGLPFVGLSAALVAHVIGPG